MKLSEMNTHQKVAALLVKEAMSDWIGGLENALEDYAPGTEEYENAKSTLELGHDWWVQAIYSEVMANSNNPYFKHLRFAGEKFIKELIDKRLTKWGY